MRWFRARACVGRAVRELEQRVRDIALAELRIPPRVLAARTALPPGMLPEAPADRAKAIMICSHIYEDIQVPMWDSFWGWKDWERDVLGG